MKNLITLTILVVMIAGIATATVATETVMAKKHHDKPTGSSAMERGAHDETCSQDSDCPHLYITQKDKGFGDHSEKFNHNYVKGWCAASHNKSGSDADEATFDCPN